MQTTVGNLVVALAGLLLFSAHRLSAEPLPPPTIHVVGFIGNTTAAVAVPLSFQNSTHIVVPKNQSLIVLNCNASYPVRWSQLSLEQPWFSALEITRMVGNFGDPSTYNYSMSLGLYNNNAEESDHPGSGGSSSKPEEYNCMAVGAGQGSTMAMATMTVTWESLTVLSVTTTKSNSEPIPPIEFTPDSIAAHLNRHNPALTMTEDKDGNVGCCLNSNGSYSNYTSVNFVIDYRFCHSQPLSCIRTAKLTSQTFMESHTHDRAISAKCRSINTASAFHWFSGSMTYNCHMRTDRVFSRDEYRGEYDMASHLNHSENAYLLSSKPATLQYFEVVHQGLTSSYNHNHLTDISNLTFEEGQHAMFWCHGNGLYYASPNVWELEWENGARELNPKSLPWRSYYSPPEYLNLTITSNLTKISCHIPFWNSSAWTTLSLFPKSVSSILAAAPASTWGRGNTAMEREQGFWPAVLIVALVVISVAGVVWLSYVYIAKSRKVEVLRLQEESIQMQEGYMNLHEEE